MNTLDLLSPSQQRPINKWLPQTGGLLAAGIVAVVVCRLPVLHTLSWSEIVRAAVECVLGVFAASALTAWTLSMIQMGTSQLDALRAALRASLNALWLAPLAFFIRENSAWTVVIAAVLATTVTKSFRRLQDASEPAGAGQSPDLIPNPKTLTPTESSPGFWPLISSTGAALCAQAGALAGFAGYSFTAAALVGISAAVWTWSFTGDAGHDTSQSEISSRSTSRILLAMAMAIVFMVGGLIRYLPSALWTRGFGVPSTRHSRRLVAHLEQSGKQGREKVSESGGSSGQAIGEKGSEDPAEAVSNANSGIILWPREQTHTKLVAPTSAIGNGLLKTSLSAKPLTIPFSGVYWFFKAPDLHPPNTSRQAHGSPELLDIHSTDRRPLSMEAHENFGSMIDVDCCSRIQIAIRNADLYPETVSLELILVNSSLPGKPSVSLGTIMAKSTPSWKIYERPSPRRETLNFPIPADHSLHRFDEVMIVFRLAALRADDGAKIAIDHLVLVPRGL